jgi:hypothetical protein
LAVQDFVNRLRPEVAGLFAMTLVCIIDFSLHGAFFLNGLEACRKRKAPAAAVL